MYFADFSYFAKRYFPEPWGDRFGGIFHNLGGDWCNASDKYIQGHLMYESPFILLRFLKPNPKAHKYLVSERSISASYGLPYCRITASSGMVSVATFFI